MIEIGSGTCQLSNYLAIGTNNEICAFDSSLTSLKIGKKFAKENNIPNIHFIRGDIFDKIFEDPPRAETIFSNFSADCPLLTISLIFFKASLLDNVGLFIQSNSAQRSFVISCSLGFFLLLRKYSIHSITSKEWPAFAPKIWFISVSTAVHFSSNFLEILTRELDNFFAISIFGLKDPLPTLTSITRVLIPDEIFLDIFTSPNGSIIDLSFKIDKLSFN